MESLFIIFNYYEISAQILYKQYFISRGKKCNNDAITAY